MRKDNIFRRLFNRLFPGRESETNTSNGSEPQLLPAIARMLEATEEVELTCDEVFVLLDEYVEMAARGEDVAHLMPLVKHHLSMCIDCREEYEALERVLENLPQDE
jgi:hypothetical protein